jgi:uncharacterized membrane protein YeaQ/YmgE (transglycosylase-associated protein family)
MNLNLDLNSLIVYAIVGLAAGWIASKLIKNTGMGLIGMLVIGFLGSLLGGWIFSAANFTINANIWVVRIIVATVGAVIVLWVYNLISGKSGKK